MKDRAKLTVTLSMIWIGAMALASTPEWIAAARDFVTRRAGGATVKAGSGASSGDTQRSAT